MFNLIPNTYVIIVMFLIAIYYANIRFKWQVLSLESIDIRVIKEMRKLAGRAKFLCIVFMIIGFALAILDLLASQYVLFE